MSAKLSSDDEWANIDPEDITEDMLNGPYEEYIPPRREIELRPEQTSLLQKQIRQGVVDYDSSEVTIYNPNNLPQFNSTVSINDLQIKQNLYQGMVDAGYRCLTKVQGHIFQILMDKQGPNLLIQSQSGTGKSTAFAIAMLNSVVESKQFPQALCVAPTIELANQISQQVRNLARFMTDITCSTATKNVGINPNELLSSQVVVGTPGTILDWVNRSSVIDLHALHMFILDEADIMLNMGGFIEQSVLIMKLLDSNCKIGLFSATYQPEIVEVARCTVPHIVEFRLEPKTEFMGNVCQFYFICQNRIARFEVVKKIYGELTVGKSIIFCKTRSSAQWIGEKLRAMGAAEIEVLCGDMGVDERANVILNFRTGCSRFLIATNIVARGIDIEGVNLVINYDVPMQVKQPTEPDYDTYVHRVGRAGRLGICGVAVNLIAPNELVNIQKIMQKFGIVIEPLSVEGSARIASQ